MVGGETPGDMSQGDDLYFGVKNMGAAARLTLGDDTEEGCAELKVLSNIPRLSDNILHKPCRLRVAAAWFCIRKYKTAGATEEERMTNKRWLKTHTQSLAGKCVAISGPTGGLGRELCRYLAGLGAELILLDRNERKSQALQTQLRREYPDVRLSRIPLDLEDPAAVAHAAAELTRRPPDVLILGAGAYSIPRHVCATGLDNVFQIDCASPYCLVQALLPTLRRQRTRVVAVGSIAHTYSHADAHDIDFSGRRAASKVYGNAKRYLMFSLIEQFVGEHETSLSVVHPGITFTNITAHYPPLLFALIKWPMKVIFMSPRRAALSLLRGVFEPCSGCEWIGPWLFHVWGLPVRRALRTCAPEERRQIADAMEIVAADWKKRYGAVMAD